MGCKLLKLTQYLCNSSNIGKCVKWRNHIIIKDILVFEVKVIHINKSFFLLYFLQNLRRTWI
jgi:hypothetical protein